MKTYNTQKKVDKDTINGILRIEGDVEFTFDVIVNGDIDAWDIEANNIDADNIYAMNIRANNIEFSAVCFACKTFECKSVKGRRGNSKFFCLDSEIKYKPKTHTISFDGKNIELSEESYQSIKKQFKGK